MANQKGTGRTDERGRPEDIRPFPRRLSDVLVAAHAVAPEWHRDMPAAQQPNIDNAVSKTVNLPARV